MAPFGPTQHASMDNSTMIMNPRALAGGEEVAYMPLYFLFIGLLMGAMSLWLQLKVAPSFPYTALMFIEGAILGVAHTATEEGLGELSDSIDSWISMDPYLLMAVFLPSLIFADVMRINMHQFQTIAFWPALILSVPGVIITGLIMGVVAQFMFGYELDWYASILFGILLGATDPVSIVALLESCGAPARLTLLMSSESHLADLTVLVIFKFFLDIVTTGTEELLEPKEAVKFVFRLVFIAPVVGIVFGGVGYFLIRQSTSPTRSSEIIAQVAITIVTAYLSFLVSEHNFESNGIIASVSAAWIFAKYAWPKFASRETMENVWGAIEYIGTTLIFLLAGLIFGGTVYSIGDAGNLTGRDVANVVIAYIFVFLARSFVVLCAFPVIKRILGGNFSKQEALVTIVGGVRGAVTMTLAIVVLNSADSTSYQDEIAIHFGVEYERALGKIFFIVGCIVFLTITCNQLLFSLLLRVLGLTKNSKTQEILHEYVNKRVRDNSIALVHTMRQEEAYRNVTIHDVAALMQNTNVGDVFKTIEEEGDDEDASNSKDEIDPSKVTLDDVKNKDLLENVRGMFLNAVRAQYWEQIHDGKLPKKSEAAVILLDSIDIASDDVAFKLDDFSPLKLFQRLQYRHWVERMFDLMDACLPDCVTLDNYVQTRFSNKRREEVVYMATCFIEAHIHAEAKLAEYVGDDVSIDTAEEAFVIKESRLLRKRAEKLLALAKKSDIEVVKQVHVIKVANAIIEYQRHYITELATQGIVSAKFLEEQMEVIRADQVALTQQRRNRFRQLASTSSKHHIVAVSDSSSDMA